MQASKLYKLKETINETECSCKYNTSLTIAIVLKYFNTRFPEYSIYWEIGKH